MATYLVRYSFSVVDFNGDVAHVSFPDRLSDAETFAMAATNVATLAGVLAAATNGKIIRQSFQVLVNEAQYLVGTAPPTNAEYSSVTDGAKVSFADGAGERMGLTVPAPIEALFGASSNVVDSTQTQAAALIAAVEATCHSPNGVLYNLYTGGAKTGRRYRKRVTRKIP